MDNAETLAHGDSWQEWGKQFGWTLYGWTEDYVASFLHRNHRLPTIEITRDIRADIDAMIAQREKSDG